MKLQEIKTIKFDGFGVLVNHHDEAIYIQNFSDGNKHPYIHVVDTTCRKYRDINLPPGKYKIIGIKTEITEEQAKEIVPCSERHDYMFPNYLKESDRYINLFKTALESFNSLMQKLEIKSDTKVLIIQKIKQIWKT